MNILFLSHYKWPHVGGVEKHVYEISQKLKIKSQKVMSISAEDIKYPKIKFFGLIYIWFWLYKNRKLIIKADIIHIHDVFIWYLPFKFLYPNKKVFTTIHGLEWDTPLSNISTWQKRLAVKFSNGTTGVGKFLEKYLRVKFDLISYGAAEKITSLRQGFDRRGNTIVYVGRLEENTGILQFLKWLDCNTTKGFKVDFCGDGRMREKCEKYGTVHGFCDPTPFYKNAEICVPGGYLAALEAKSYDCELKLYWNNKVKEDYWKMSPFYQLKGKKLKAWARQQTWEKLANEYLDLYNNV